MLRVGGDSTDWTWWPVPGMRRPGGVKLDLTPGSMAVTKAVAQDLGAKLILGINLEADSTRVAAAEARAFADRVGAASIGGLEIGNEAELYPAFNWYRTAAGVGVRGRPPGYDFASMIGDFSRMAAVMPDVPLAGPSSGSPEFLPSLSTFLAREPKVKIATVHAYPLKHCAGAAPVTESDLLSDTASNGLASTVAPWVAAAHHRGVPMRVDEMNAITCGGTRGISNTYGSALWALDTMFAMAQAGVDGVNVHTVPGTINEILGPTFAHGKLVDGRAPRVLWAADVRPGGPSGIAAAVARWHPPSGVKVWAVRAPDHSIRVVVINKLRRRTMTIPVSWVLVTAPATLERLEGRSLSATSAVSLGGQSFGTATTTGKLAPAQAISLAPSGGVYSVRVPAASAALLTVPAK